MTSLLILPQTKDEQQGFEFGKPRKRKPRRKLSKQEQLRRAIQAHMEEQRQALFAWMNDFQADHPGMLPPMFPGWFHFGLGTLAMSERMTPILQAIWEPAGTRLTARVGLDPDSWSVVNPHTAGKIQGASLAFCKETNDSTSLDLNEALDKLRQELQEGIVTHGESVEQLTKRVQSVFDTATKSRARTIAQTETSRAVHAAQDDAAKSSGVVTGWRWQLSGDACPVCVAIAARKPVTKLGEPFAIIGKNPHYSHIYMPPAHPRCNCTAVEIVDTDPQPDFHKHPTLVQPKPSTDAELEQIRTERHQRDEAILRGSEAWGAAPYAERYPGGRPKWFLPTKRYKGFQESEHPRDDHGRWASTGAGHTFGKSKAEVHAGHGPAEIARQQSRTRELLGTTDTNHIASVVGATDDATVMVGGGENENGGELTVRTMHPKYHTERKIRKDSKDRTYIVAAKFDVVKSEQGKGNYGPQVFGRMVEQAAEAKVDRIVTLASRSPNENGYYTWARFGYDAELDLRDKRKLPETMKHATHVSDLMMTPEGRAHWKEHGDTKRMKFDLKPNSRSMKIWRAYLEEKKPTSPTKTWKPQTRRGRHSPKRSKHFIRMDHRS